MEKGVSDKVDRILWHIENPEGEIQKMYKADKERFGLLHYSSGAVAGWVLLLTAIVNESWQGSELFHIGLGNLILGIGGLILMFWLPLSWWVQKKTRK